MDQRTLSFLQVSNVFDAVSACPQVLGHQAFSLPPDQMRQTPHAAQADPPSQA